MQGKRWSLLRFMDRQSSVVWSLRRTASAVTWDPTVHGKRWGLLRFMDRQSGVVCCLHRIAFAETLGSNTEHAHRLWGGACSASGIVKVAWGGACAAPRLP